MLEVSDVVLRFGGITALDGVSFRVGDDEICGLIGPNGAGKTSLFNCISRIYKPHAGTIEFDGMSLLHKRRFSIVRNGVARTFQNLALWSDLTVFENAVLGAHGRAVPQLIPTMLGAGRRTTRRIESEAWLLLERLDLIEVANAKATGLPFGTLKRVELARAIMSRPRLLLLDEPAGGLTHGEVAELGALISGLREEHGFSVLVVEHHMGLVMSLCDHVVAMDFGRVLADGTASEVQRDPAVVAAYLGKTA